MPSLKHFKHIHFMLWSLIVGEIKSIMLKVWKLKHATSKKLKHEISKNTFSHRTPPVAASDAMQYLVYTHEIVAVDNHHALSHFLWPQV